MKSKLRIIIILILSYSSNLFGQTYNKQNTYLDALLLRGLKETNKFYTNKDNSGLHEEFYKILFKYGLNEANIDSNIFLKGLGLKKNHLSKTDTVFNESYSVLNQLKDITVIGNSKPKQNISNIESKNWQASVLNGMANFVGGRLKQEIFHFSIDQIFKKIKTQEDSILVKSIFPKTFKRIGELYGSGSSSYYSPDLLFLRQTAQSDIEQLPKNIFKNLEIIFPKLKNEPKIKDIFSLGNYIVEYSQQEQSLDRLITILANEKYSSDSTVYKILNVADLISQALLKKSGFSVDIWVNPIETLPATATTLERLEISFFYGLLYQQLIHIPEFKNYLENQDINQILLVAGKIQDLIRFVNKLNISYNYIKSKEFNLESPEEIVTYIKEVNKIIIFFASTLYNIPEINRLYNLDDTLFDITTSYITIVEALMKKDYQKAIPILLIEFGDYMDDKNVKYSKTITFLSQFATVKSHDDMETLLNSYALPIGGASIKRKSSFNLTVNGYVGLTGGWETAYGKQINQTKGNIGLTAPIGISATFCNGYLTPFVSFIDLGSIVNQRLNNDTTSYSNLKFEHFFSPGIGLFVNFPKLPIAAGIHFNYVPNLRSIKYESGNAIISETNRSVTRLNFSFLMDIPFFTLYNRDKLK